MKVQFSNLVVETRDQSAYIALINYDASELWTIQVLLMKQYFRLHKQNSKNKHFYDMLLTMLIAFFIFYSQIISDSFK